MKTMKMTPPRSSRPIPRRRYGTAVFIAAIMLGLLSSIAFAVPETSSVRITDVAIGSFSVVWMTDPGADPGVEVYSDSAMLQKVTDGIFVSLQPAGSGKAAQAAQAKGIMKVRVSGVRPATTYFIRTVTKDHAKQDSIAYSPLQEVTTASYVALYSTSGNTITGLMNDLAAFPVYVRPADATTEPGLGDLVLLEEQGSPYPISAFVGDGVLSPEGILDLNNLFGANGASLAVTGGDRITLRVYRAGNLATLTHYRKAAQNTTQVSIVELFKGILAADINLDGNVDDQDFLLFKAQYRTLPDDAIYNPDYNFIEDAEAKIDVREFGKFSKEYGRTDVH